MVTGEAARREPFEHVGLLYRDVDEYVRGCTRFVQRGLAAGGPVLVAVPDGHGGLIGDALGADADRVTFADMTIAGRNPGRILPWLMLRFAQQHPADRVWIIGEPTWPGRTAMEYPACAVHEALTNTAFAGRDAAIVCLYDATNLAPERIEDAWRTHPVMDDALGIWASAAYTDPVVTADRFNRPLPVPPAGAVTVRYDTPSDLATVRRLVGDTAAAAGLDPDRTDDLVMAVSELATNSLRHTPDRCGTLTMWLEPGLLVCQVDDSGRLTDPLVGRLPPAHLDHGLGLTLVNHLVDLLRIHHRPDGTTFRTHMRTGGPQGADMLDVQADIGVPRPDTTEHLAEP